MKSSAANKQVFVVYPDDVGDSLARFVAQRCGLDEAAANQRLRDGAVYVDGRRERNGSAGLRAGQKVVVFVPTAKPDQVGATLVFRDEEIAVVHKPAGVPSTLPRRGAAVSVEGFVEQQLGSRARLMHRLDQPASGLLVVSLRTQARVALATQISDRGLTRRYLALVAGVPAAPQWSMQRSLSFDGHTAHLGEGQSFRPAVTHATVLRAAGRGQSTLLQLELQTGRTHQIRAHLAGESLPIVGDERYGGPPSSRLALHAHQLSLTHPASGQLLDFHSPLPADFRVLV